MRNTSRILALLIALLTVLSAFALVGCNGTETPNDAESQDTSSNNIEEATKTETEEETKKPAETVTGLGYEGVDWINAEKFGFVADGKTPNDRIMREYIRYHAKKPLYFGEGVYAFEKTIQFTDSMYLYLDPNAELKCIAEEPIDYFITLRAGESTYGTGGLHSYAMHSFISGGMINANYKAKAALGLHGGYLTNFENFEICNVLETGIVTAMNEFKNGCFMFNNILIYNDSGIKGTVGIVDYSYDSMFDGVTIINFETGIRCSGTYFKDVSCWFNSYGKNLIQTSVYADVTSGNPIFDHPMVDTYRTGFKLSGNACINITNMTWLTNTNFYSEEDQEKYPMTYFHAESNNCRIILNGLYMPEQHSVTFSNKPLPSSCFLGVRYHSGWDPAATVKNFRDDSAAMLQIVENVGTQKTGNLTAAADLDKLYDNGLYKCEFRTGSGGKGIPAKEVGVLEVEAVSDIVIQTFTGSDTTMQRVFNGIRWGDWRTLAE